MGITRRAERRRIMLPELLPLSLLGIALIIGGLILKIHNVTYYSHDAIARRVLGGSKISEDRLREIVRDEIKKAGQI